MSLFKVFDIAGSAMSAQSVRLNTVASNMANADSVSSSVEKTYHARRPIFAAQLDRAMSDKQASVGVEVKGIVESEAPSYQTNVQVADSAKKMLQQTLQLGKS